MKKQLELQTSTGFETEKLTSEFGVRFSVLFFGEKTLLVVDQMAELLSLDT